MGAVSATNTEREIERGSKEEQRILRGTQYVSGDEFGPDSLKGRAVEAMDLMQRGQDAGSAGRSDITYAQALAPEQLQLHDKGSTFRMGAEKLTEAGVDWRNEKISASAMSQYGSRFYQKDGVTTARTDKQQEAIEINPQIRAAMARREGGGQFTEEALKDPTLKKKYLQQIKKH